MFLRMRWFSIGAVASFGVIAYAADRLRRVRENLTAANIAREAARSFAGALEMAADRVSPREPSG